MRGASSGSLGVELYRDASGGGEFLASIKIIPVSASPSPCGAPGVYKFLVDVKDGGDYGGTPSFTLSSQFGGSPTSLNNRGFASIPPA